MGGLMITEPDYGSEALKMQTSYSFDAKKQVYNINGLKALGWINQWYG